jgi:Ribbon-helix-helix protein, copG family
MATISAGPRGGKTTVTKGGLIRVVIYLSPEERKALKQAALDREMPASEVVREALRTFLDIKDG